MMKVAYPGSFNPWHNGHQYVYDQLCKMFGHNMVYIILALNPSKAVTVNDLAERKKRLIYCLNIDPNNIIVTDDTVAHTCKVEGIEGIARGIRSGQDATGEFTMADWNLEKDLQTVFIYCGASLRKLSSSAIRELESFGEDITPYVPKKVAKIWFNQ